MKYLTLLLAAASAFLWSGAAHAVPVEMNSNVEISREQIVLVERFVQKELGIQEGIWKEYNVKGLLSYRRLEFALEPKGTYRNGTIYFDGRDEGVLAHELAHVYGASEWEAYQIAWKWLYDKKEI